MKEKKRQGIRGLWVPAVFLILLVWNFFLPAKQVNAASGTKWYEISRTIAHAGGSLSGNTYTNSKEALKNSLKRGKKLIELDFTFTKDGTLVCRHGWSDCKGGKQTLKKFLAARTEGGFTPMTAEDAISILSAYKTRYLIVDAKVTDIEKVYQALKDLCVKMGKESFLDQIVVQIYYQSDYQKVKKVYSFKNWSYSLYKEKPKTTKAYRQIAAFCKKNKIAVVTIPNKKVTASRVKIFTDKKITCLVHTVNSISTYKKLRKMGVRAIFTDDL